MLIQREREQWCATASITLFRSDLLRFSRDWLTSPHRVSQNFLVCLAPSYLFQTILCSFANHFLTMSFGNPCVIPNISSGPMHVSSFPANSSAFSFEVTPSWPRTWVCYIYPNYPYRLEDCDIQSRRETNAKVFRFNVIERVDMISDNFHSLDALFSLSSNFKWSLLFRLVPTITYGRKCFRFPF